MKRFPAPKLPIPGEFLIVVDQNENSSIAEVRETLQHESCHVFVDWQQPGRARPAISRMHVEISTDRTLVARFSHVFYPLYLSIDGTPQTTYIPTIISIVNINDYRQGYKDGVEASKTPGADVVRSLFVGVESPSYRKGWDDGYNGRDFEAGEQGLFDTDSQEQAEDEEETEKDRDEAESSHHYDSSSSGGYDSTARSAPIPLTESEKRKRLLGHIVLVSAFCVSVAYDSVSNAFTFGSLVYAMFAAVATYLAYRVVYRLKFWVTPIIVLNAVLFYYEISTTPLWKVMHDIVVSDISNLAGIALIYGIYKFFTA